MGVKAAASVRETRRRNVSPVASLGPHRPVFEGLSCRSAARLYARARDGHLHARRLGHAATQLVRKVHVIQSFLEAGTSDSDAAGDVGVQLKPGLSPRVSCCVYVVTVRVAARGHRGKRP